MRSIKANFGNLLFLSQNAPLKITFGWVKQLIETTMTVSFINSLKNFSSHLVAVYHNVIAWRRNVDLWHFRLDSMSDHEWPGLNHVPDLVVVQSWTEPGLRPGQTSDAFVKLSPDASNLSHCLPPTPSILITSVAPRHTAQHPQPKTSSGPYPMIQTSRDIWSIDISECFTLFVMWLQQGQLLWFALCLRVDHDNFCPFRTPNCRH